MESFDAHKMIRAILFDYGMVLSQPAQESAHSELIVISGINRDRFDELYWLYRLDYDRGTLNKITYWQTVARDADVEFSAQQLKDLNAADIRMWTALDPKMLAWVTQLQQGGWKTGILSNIGDGLVEWMLENFHWLKAFTHCTWSYQLDLVKPDRAIYEKTVAALGVEPHEVLFLDDREENVDGAKAVGLHALQFTSLENLVPHLATYGVPEPTQ